MASSEGLMKKDSRVSKMAVKIQPVALYSLFEQYQRRSESCPYRLVGAIYGQVSHDGEHGGGDSNDGDRILSIEATDKLAASTPTLEIGHCFPVPHSEVGDQVAINGEYFKMRNQLHKKCHGKDSALLGWYSIIDESSIKEGINQKPFEVIPSNTSFIHDFFAREVAHSGISPIVVHLRTIIGAKGVSYTADITECGKGTTESLIMSDIPVKLQCYAQEAFALNAVADSLSTERYTHNETNGRTHVQLPSNSEYVAESLIKVKSYFDRISVYLEQVRNGAIPEDPEVTCHMNALMETMSKMSDMAPKRLIDDTTLLSSLITKLNAQLENFQEIVDCKLKLTITTQ